MAKMAFDPKNKAEQQGDFPRLKLAKGDRVRVLCLEEPEFAWTHTLKMPALVDGKSVTHKTTNWKGEPVERMKMDFVGRPLCLGDYGVLEDSDGVDPDNCPACAKAVESDIVSKPDRRFAMHVITYATKQGGFDLAKPFSCSCVVWSFGDSVYNKLTDFVSQWGSLTNHDLFLGPCENADFQKFEIAISSSAAWQEDDQRKATVVETYQENQTKDLEAMCGRKVTKAFMDEDIEKIVYRWDIINGKPLFTSDASDDLDRRSLTEGLGNLLNSQGLSNDAATDPPADKTMNFNDLFPGQVTSTEPKVETEAPKAATSGEASFADLLDMSKAGE